ncbi:MAG: hypothetical protein ACXV3D_03750 [Halobacteriota archaeon]
MKIKDAAERLIELGIPGKDKKDAIKNRLVKQDSSHVKRGLIRYVEKMLVRWAYTEEVIQKPERHEDKRGRGKTSIWPDTTVEEAAAVWVIRKKWHEMHDGKKSRLSKDKIDVIKRVASVIDDSPYAVYTLPTIVGPLSTQHLTPDDITIKFVSEECDGLDFFPGKDNAEKVDCLNTLVVSWIAALEKVRAWASAAIEAQKKHEMGAKYENPLLAAEFDVSHIDPWSVEGVKCQWRLDKPARVALCWSTTRTEFSKLPAALLKSDSDQLILLENFVDTRSFFKIDVVGSAEWAKTVRENIERQLQKSTSSAEQLLLSAWREQLLTLFPY